MRFARERELLARGHGRIAGVDEAGRGPLAGPVVAAAVVFPVEWIRDGMPSVFRDLNDSKQLTAARREAFFELLVAAREVQRGVAWVHAAEIDQLNILRATEAAMAAALGQVLPPPDHVLVDGRPVAALGRAQTALVKGDALSYSIAAASVLAKVTRDRWMVEADARWPGYGFAVHKGYPTAAHQAALARLGPCPIHRRSFAPVAAAAVPLDLFPP